MLHRVDVIIPCYNVESLVQEAVLSALDQESVEVRVICVDNNSTDGTLKKLQTLQRIHHQVQVYSESTPGAAAARNKGLYASDAPFVQFLDADDMLIPGKLKRQVELLRQQPTAAFVAAASVKQFVDGKTQTTLPLKEVWIGLFTANLGNTSANLFRRHTRLAVGGWDVRLGSSQEYDLMFRILTTNSEIAFDNLPGAIVRERESGQISQGDPTERWNRFVNLRVRMLRHIIDKHEAYYHRNKEVLGQALFDAIRILAQYDLPRAIHVHREYLPSGFRPKPSLTTSSQYLLSYKWLGFEKAEKLKRFLKKAQ